MGPGAIWELLITWQQYIKMQYNHVHIEGVILYMTQIHFLSHVPVDVFYSVTICALKQQNGNLGSGLFD